ncbi:MAG TPA: TPM domain-containing protein [Candidatus Dormibacteraeota bacterium]|nr:TPM domain-containing protein [Candidatus Dormibacteraeota bacterium]
MRRWIGSGIGVVLVVLLAFVVPALAGALGAGTDAFPDPVTGTAVYDPAGALEPGIEQALEGRIDAIEARSGAEIVVYVRQDAAATDESNLADARGLIDQWGIGREGFDDGFVLLLSFDDPSFQHGVLSTFAGGGFRAAYLGEGEQTVLRDEVVIPAIQQGALDGGLVSAIDIIDAAITESATGRLDTLRVVNAMVGIPGSILALLVTLGLSYTAWRRYGDDPALTDSPSILMAGPPAGMTPPLATVLRDGRATQHTINTTMVELASMGRIAFRNLDRVGKGKSDDDPDPLIDPAIDIPKPPAEARPLAAPQEAAYETIVGESIGGVLDRERLWGLNDALKPIRERLDDEAVRLGWLARRPMPLITRWVVIGVIELVAGAGLVFLGYAIPMSGLTLLGAALAIGGIGTAAFGSAMSQRTPQGAYVDSMLKAYRRTLSKTLDQARNMNEVVAEPTVRLLADTPDKAVVWGIALGLHKEVAEVLRRGLEGLRPGETATGAYYPLWLGSSPGSSSSGGSLAGSGDGAGLFSGSGTPDVGGMFSALGSIGSSPPSSSSGGGFGGGGSSSGGGGSSSF